MCFISSAYFQIFSTPTVRRAVLLGCSLQMFQQIAGINTVMYYSAKIIAMAGVSDDSLAIWISAGVASVNFLCTFIGLWLVERLGRRKLLLISMFGVILSLGFLAVGFQARTVLSHVLNATPIGLKSCCVCRALECDSILPAGTSHAFR